jgi:hypothetical protein
MGRRENLTCNNEVINLSKLLGPTLSPILDAMMEIDERSKTLTLLL